MININKLKNKALLIRKETLKIYQINSDIRLASSLSPIEIFTVLYYGKILKYDSKNILSEKRDRLIISKPHGAVCLYPILADLGFINKKELLKIGKNNSLLGGIPDNMIPGIETINGALGHGLGVACGISLGLKNKKSNSKVFVLSGDGELFEGAVWEAIMFAGHHKLDNLILIIDNNKISMLDYCKNIIDLNPLKEKFETLKWEVETVDGHNIKELINCLKQLKQRKNNKPKLLIANTIKGKGVSQLENDSLCHVKKATKQEIINAINKLDEK